MISSAFSAFSNVEVCQIVPRQWRIELLVYLSMGSELRFIDVQRPCHLG